MLLHRPSQRAITLTIVAVAFLYAIVRSHVMRGTPWEHLPLFVSNKAVAFASVIFIVLSYILGPLARFWPDSIVPMLGMRKFFGLVGFGLGAMHGLMSLLLFSPANYGRFFLDDGKLTLNAELSMLFGILSLMVFTIVACTSLPGVTQTMDQARWQTVQRLGYGGLVLVLLHVVFMGYRGWGDPSGWPGGMLPISLIAAICIAVALLFRILVLISPGEYKAAT